MSRHERVYIKRAVSSRISGRLRGTTKRVNSTAACNRKIRKASRDKTAAPNAAEAADGTAAKPAHWTIPREPPQTRSNQAPSAAFTAGTNGYSLFSLSRAPFPALTHRSLVMSLSLIEARTSMRHLIAEAEAVAKDARLTTQQKSIRLDRIEAELTAREGRYRERASRSPLQLVRRLRRGDRSTRVRRSPEPARSRLRSRRSGASPNGRARRSTSPRTTPARFTRPA